jgi:hypothetical protein
MGSLRDSRRHLAFALDRVAIALIGIYLVLFVAAVIPPHFKDPTWLLEALNALRGVAFLPLIGGGLILVASQVNRHSAIISMHRMWIRKFVPLVVVGFFLMIPLQGAANYWILGESRGEAMQKIKKLTRGMELISLAQDEYGLRLGIDEVGIVNAPQGRLIVPVAIVKKQILDQLSPRIAKLQNEINISYPRALRGLIFQWLRDSAVAFLYGFGFRGLIEFDDDIARDVARDSARDIGVIPLE